MRPFGPSFNQRLIVRLLRQNQQLMDRLLMQSGVMPVERALQPRTTAPATEPRLEDDLDAARRDEEAEIEARATLAAASEEAMARAIYEAETDPRWQEVVNRAFAKMQAPTF